VAEAGGVAALAVDDGFAVGTVDETGATLGEGCVGEASAGP
jgi:7-keto-8-aminopelargonate synthetase-like enzyme